MLFQISQSDLFVTHAREMNSSALEHMNSDFLRRQKRAARAFEFEVSTLGGPVFDVVFECHSGPLEFGGPAVITGLEKMSAFVLNVVVEFMPDYGLLTIDTSKAFFTVYIHMPKLILQVLENGPAGTWLSVGLAVVQLMVRVFSVWNDLDTLCAHHIVRRAGIT